MRNLAIFVFFMLAIIYLMTSGDSEPDVDGESVNTAGSLGASETFTWQGAQPIRFSPPAGWQSGRSQQGGRNGVRYILSGQRIAITEYTNVGQLDGCASLQEVLADLGTADFNSLNRKLRTTVRNPVNTSSATEARLLRRLKESTSKAIAALGNDDLKRVRREIDNAIGSRFSSELKLDDYLDQVIYEQTARGDIKRVDIGLPETLLVGGEPAVSIDYEVDISAQYATGVLNKTEVGREVYVMSSNRLFIAAFQGRPENMNLFEQVVDSIAFPDGLCSI